MSLSRASFSSLLKGGSTMNYGKKKPAKVVKKKKMVKKTKKKAMKRGY
tara:strand:- start:3129 stop:3272 length:144 start_codon:yes stop_codon:yes gene_type:complete